MIWSLILDHSLTNDLWSWSLIFDPTDLDLWSRSFYKWSCPSLAPYIRPGRLVRLPLRPPFSGYCYRPSSALASQVDVNDTNERGLARSGSLLIPLMACWIVTCHYVVTAHYDRPLMGQGQIIQSRESLVTLREQFVSDNHSKAAHWTRLQLWIYGALGTWPSDGRK